MKPITWKKWTVGIIVAVVFALLTAGAGLTQGMSWHAFVAVLCTALITQLGGYLMKHPIEAVEDEQPKPPTSHLGVWIFAALLALGTISCGGLPKAVVTVTGVVDAGMKEWAKAHNDGKTTPAIDANVRAAHAIYAEAAGRAATIYELALKNGDTGGRLAALRTIKEAAELLLDELIPAITAPEVNDLKLRLEGARIP